MAIVGLSEFTFGYGFLFEQTRQNWNNLRAAPILPSLIQEADAAWDARLPLVGTDFYYQFKLSDFLERRNSLFHKDGTYNAPYYRIALHRRDNNRQHHRLWIHAQANPNTFYVAPEFDNIDDFNTAFLAQQLAQRSRIIPLTQCDDCTDGDQHYVTYQPGNPGWIQHSEKKRREQSYTGDQIERLYSDTRTVWRKIDRAFANETMVRAGESVRKALETRDRRDTASIDKLEEALSTARATQTTGAILRETAQLLAAFVGVTMVIIGDSRE